MFYVYELRDENAKVFYVGKGKGKRAYQHRHRAKAGDNTHRAHKIRAIWQRGADFTVTIVFKTSDEQEAFTEEKRLIAFYGRENLTNKTDGGDGPSNPSKDVRERIAAGRRGIKISEETRQRLRDSHIGQERTPETRAKISAAQKGTKKPWASLPKTAEHQAKINASLKGKVKSEEAKRKFREKRLGHIVTEETRKKISESKKGVKTPQTGNKGFKHSAEAKGKMKAAQIKRRNHERASRVV
jgi:hypothetical protein